MNNTTHRVGKDVLSNCTKCKLTLSHTIVSMLDAVTVSKVKCNTCQTIHKYKDPAGQMAARKSGTPFKRQPTPIHNVWEEAVNNPKISHRPYSIQDKFLSGDVIDHPKFGLGLVDGPIDNDKIRVIFQKEQKTLLHNKK